LERTGYLRLIWARKFPLIIFAVVAAVVVYAVSSREADQYESRALGQIVSSTQAEGNILTEEELLSLSNIFATLANTSSVLEIARQDPAVKEHGSEFNSSVDIEQESRVGILGFTATTEDSERSAEFANAYANAFAEYLTERQVEQRKTALVPLQTRIDEINSELSGLSTESPEYAALQVELQSLQDQIASRSSNPGDTLRVIEPAVATSDPVSPKPTRNAILAFVAALILGIVFVYLIDLFFDRYRSSQEAARDLGLPIMGEIPRGDGNASLESFRTLRTAAMFSIQRSPKTNLDGTTRECSTLLITGGESGSGKSYITSNLVRTLAAEGRRVVAIDGDLRRPTLHEVFGIQLNPGLGDLLLSDQASPASQVAISIPEAAAGSPGELRVLPAGKHDEAAVEWLSSERMQRVVADLQTEADVVVFDSPPTLIVVDPVVLSRYADGVLFVVDSRKTRRRDARRSIEALRATGAPLLGIVFNRSSTKQSGYYYNPDRSGAGRLQNKETRV
jgi:polysaccharide biosynthesis transport protein